MARSNQTNKKLEELLYRSSMKPSFQGELKAFRGLFGIPENGFTSERSIRSWIAQRDKPLKLLRTKGKITSKTSKPIDLFKYYLGLSFFLRFFKLPNTSIAQGLLEEYVLSNNKIKIHGKLNNAFCEVELPEDSEVKNGRFFVRLRIYDSASQADVNEYVKKSWSLIKIMFKHQGAGKTGGRIRGSINKDRDELIFGLYQQSIKDLRTLLTEFGCDAPVTHKINLVSRIMREMHSMNVKPDNVKKIVERQKKLRR